VKVLILGANGMLGPWVSNVLKKDHEIIETDLKEIDSNSNFHKVDISDTEEVINAAEGVDAIINLSVHRRDRILTFDVNTKGNLNMMLAAQKHNINNIINTGPHFQSAGPSYENFDFEIQPEIPPQPGVNLYAITKSLGQEICKVFSDKNDSIYLQTLLFYNFYARDLEPGGPIDRKRMPPQPKGTDLTPYSIVWEDAAEAIKCALEINLESLPTRTETYFVFADLPHNKFSNKKAKEQLGWSPKYNLKDLWLRP
jgi:nucleoside-diphosphate-sugar epimerase